MWVIIYYIKDGMVNLVDSYIPPNNLPLYNMEETQEVKNQEQPEQPKANTLVDEANAAAERLEKANERKAELIRQEEELAAKKALGGQSEAGQPQKPKEETPKEYADRIMKNNVK